VCVLVVLLAPCVRDRERERERGREREREIERESERASAREVFLIVKREMFIRSSR
jgi:hypothetical protein